MWLFCRRLSSSESSLPLIPYSAAQSLTLCHFFGMISMKHFTSDLWKIWEARPDDRKFILVCIVRSSLSPLLLSSTDAPKVTFDFNR